MDLQNRVPGGNERKDAADDILVDLDVESQSDLRSDFENSLFRMTPLHFTKRIKGSKAALERGSVIVSEAGGYAMVTCLHR